MARAFTPPPSAHRAPHWTGRKILTAGWAVEATAQVPLLGLYLAFNNSAELTRAMPASPRQYDSLRPHSALGGRPPVSRLVRNSSLATTPR